MDTKYLDVIKAPVVTEKAAYAGQNGVYSFYVDPKSNKTEIKLAIEKLFNVKVLNVNTITVKGKEKRVGANTGRRPDWKKAIVAIDTNPTEKSYLTKGGKEVKIDKKYKDSIDEFMGA